MKRETKQPVKQETEFSKDGHNEEAKLLLVNLLFDTPEEKLAELTNIPLNQVLPFAMTATIEDAVKMMASRARGEEIEPMLLSERFRKYYAQYRRSVPGAYNHKMALATLTQEEMAMKVEEEEGEAEDL